MPGRFDYDLGDTEALGGQKFTDPRARGGQIWLQGREFISHDPQLPVAFGRVLKQRFGGFVLVALAEGAGLHMAAPVAQVAVVEVLFPWRNPMAACLFRRPRLPIPW